MRSAISGVSFVSLSVMNHCLRATFGVRPSRRCVASSKKLSVATGGKNYIETVWGRGYVLREPDENEVYSESA